MKIGDLLNKKPERDILGKTIYIQLTTHAGEHFEEEFFFGKVKKSAKNGITVETAEGEMHFPPQQDVIYAANGESFTMPDGKIVKPQLHAVFSLYRKTKK